MFKLQKGLSLVELILAIGLSSLFLPIILSGFTSSREGKAQQAQRLEATAYLQEAQEAVRVVREKGWSYINQNGTYHPEVVGSTWELVSGSETINGFAREIIIYDVYRNTQGDIVESGGSIDPSTKKVEMNVSWNTPYSSNISSTTYLTRFQNNLTFVQTTEADFNQGETTDLAITNLDGGEIMLGAGGSGSDWCEPDISETTLDLPKQGEARAISAIEGYIAAGTGENASGVSYAGVSLTNDNPPVASIEATYDGYKTNDIYTDSQYAYIATDDNQKEVVILDVSTTPYTEIGYFDSPGSLDADSIYISGDKGYVTTGWWLSIFDLSQKTGSRPQIGGQYFLFGLASSIVVKENYAYVSVKYSIIEMQIIDISNPYYLYNIGYGDVNAEDGKRIFINETSTRAYLVTDESPSLPEFFIIDISSKSGPRPTIGTYDANGMNPTDLTVVPGNRAIIVGHGAEEYQVINIIDEENPVRCGGANVDNDINGINSVLEQDGDAYSYIITGDDNNELKIIEGGPGGIFTSTGSFESSIFDAGSEVGFNRVNITSTVPQSTTFDYQIAIADDIGGSCNGANYIYVGPDGTTATYFTSSDSLPLDNDGSGYENPGRCFRYKLFLETEEITQSPIFYDIRVNYSL